VKEKNKEPETATPIFVARKVVYEVKGTKFRISYIDSVSVFRQDQVYTGSFRYEFRRGPGASIGFSVYKFSSSDTIAEWRIMIDNKLYALAFSEGGAYLDIPFR
jgi:hypothetical protein